VEFTPGSELGLGFGLAFPTEEGITGTGTRAGTGAGASRGSLSFTLIGRL
jgi:hypothetical protein